MPQHAAACRSMPQRAIFGTVGGVSEACRSMPQHAAANFFLKILLMRLLLLMLLLMLMLLEEFQRVSQLLFPRSPYWRTKWVVHQEAAMEKWEKGHGKLDAAAKEVYLRGKPAAPKSTVRFCLDWKIVITNGLKHAAECRRMPQHAAAGCQNAGPPMVLAPDLALPPARRQKT